MLRLLRLQILIPRAPSPAENAFSGLLDVGRMCAGW